MKLKLAVALLLPALVFVRPVRAQDACADRTAPPRTAAEAQQKLRQLQLSDCLGGNRCPTALCTQFTTWSVVKDAEGAVELLTAIRNSAATAPRTESTRRLIGRIDAWIGAVGSDALATSAPAQWTYQAGGGGLFLDTESAIALDSLIESNAMTFAEAVEIITDATLVRRVNGTLLKPQRDAVQKYATALDGRWTRYFNQAPAQFPWELLLNSSIYRRNERRGYNEPPPWQLVFLHPVAAYEYVSEESQKFKAAFAIEPIGYFTHGVGLSAIVVLADRSVGRKLGFGAVVHLQNKFTLGVTHHAGGVHAVSLLISPNLEQLVTANVKRIRDIFTRVQ